MVLFRDLLEVLPCRGETAKSQVYYGQTPLHLQDDWEMVFREAQLQAETSSVDQMFPKLSRNIQFNVMWIQRFGRCVQMIYHSNYSTCSVFS